jgi:hypothetical protein
LTFHIQSEVIPESSFKGAKRLLFPLRMGKRYVHPERVWAGKKGALLPNLSERAQSLQIIPVLEIRFKSWLFFAICVGNQPKKILNSGYLEAFHSWAHSDGSPFSLERA